RQADVFGMDGSTSFNIIPVTERLSGYGFDYVVQWSATGDSIIYIDNTQGNNESVGARLMKFDIATGQSQTILAGLRELPNLQMFNSTLVGKRLDHRHLTDVLINLLTGQYYLLPPDPGKLEQVEISPDGQTVLLVRSYS